MEMARHRMNITKSLIKTAYNGQGREILRERKSHRQLYDMVLCQHNLDNEY